MHSERSTKTLVKTEPRPIHHGRPVRERVAAAPRRAASMGIPSSAALAVLLVVMLVRTAASTYVVSVPSSDINVRPFGNPQKALERIERDNFTTVAELNAMMSNPQISDIQRLVYRHAPLILYDSSAWPAEEDTFIGVYYLASETRSEETTVTTIQYFFFSTDESGGMLVHRRLALFGQPIDRELIYRVLIVDGSVASAHFQAPQHRLTPINYRGEHRPVFAIASANHNFRPVWPEELEERADYELLAPIPRHEWVADPAHDPDFVALAARQALDRHGINLSHYVYVELQNPVYNGLVTVSVLSQGRWYYLQDSIAGLTRPGYNKAGIHVGFPPAMEHIEDIWIVMQAPSPPDLQVISVFLYPYLEVPA